MPTNHDGLTSEEWNLGVESMGLILHNLWPEMPDLSVSEYAERYRTLPLGTPFPGPWSNDRTPYLREMMDDMGPQSLIQEEYCLKGHQIGFTAAAENIVLYWMDLNPTELLFISATDELLKDWVTKRLEPAIDSVGMRHKIVSKSENRRTRRSGDNTFSKEFLGGSLKMASAQSAASLRSMSKRVLIMDEMDGAPAKLKTGEGIYTDVAMARTTAFGNRKKILGFSTPTTIEDSLIWAKYEAGDQRKFLVPCPICGRPQELVLSVGDMKYGLKGDMIAGKLDHAYYVCEFCYETFFDHQKVKMLANGHWEASKESCRKTYRSRHISALYSPPGMCSWDEFYQKYLDAQNDPNGMRSFTNLYLGLPYTETGSRPTIQKMQTLRGNYHECNLHLQDGTISPVPDGVLYLTAGVDVQKGSEKDERNPARLEMEVLGHGLGYRTWSITYQIFKGPTDNAFECAWEKLWNWFNNPDLSTFRRRGISFRPQMIFVDSGFRPEVTYQFCSRAAIFQPVKGMPQVEVREGERFDIEGGFKFYRLAQVGGGQWIYELNTQMYKKGVYGDLGRSGDANRQGFGIQRTSFADFPLEYSDEYFAQLASEEELIGGKFKQIRERNEALDCRVYAKASGHVRLDLWVKEWKEWAKKSGWRQYDIENTITPGWVLQNLEKALAAKETKT